MSERRQNLHQSRVGGNLAASSGVLQDAVTRTSAYLQAHGFGKADATAAAYGQVYGRLHAQTQLLAFMDCFFLLGVITLVAAPTVLLSKDFRQTGKAPAGH